MTTFKPGETYKTRDGREARVYAVDGDSAYPIHGAILGVDGWVIRTWTKGGTFDCRPGNTASDLMPPKRELWVNVYDSGAVSYGFVCRDDADESAGKYRIARIRVEFQEGQFDD